MDSVLNTLALWENEGIVIVMVLTGVVMAHCMTKLWGAPIDTVLALILVASAVLAGFMFYFVHFFGFALSTRALWFVVLYMWCVLAMLFFAARNTHRIKLCLGLISQAGILYALFVFL